jgi:hypothetical protein
MDWQPSQKGERSTTVPSEEQKGQESTVNVPGCLLPVFVQADDLFIDPLGDWLADGTLHNVGRTLEPLQHNCRPHTTGVTQKPAVLGNDGLIGPGGSTAEDHDAPRSKETSS